MSDSTPCRVGQSVSPSVFFFNCERCLHYCPCQTVRDSGAVYPALFPAALLVSWSCDATVAVHSVALYLLLAPLTSCMKWYRCKSATVEHAGHFRPQRVCYEQCTPFPQLSAATIAAFSLSSSLLPTPLSYYRGIASFVTVRWMLSIDRPALASHSQ